MGRLPGRGGRRRRAASGSGRAASRTPSRYFGPFLDAADLDRRATQAIVDGEVIALDEHGEPDFALLQARIKGRGAAAEPTPFVYEVFDLLHLDGRSLLDEPLEERRRLLASVLRPDPRVRLSEHIEADGIAFFEAARVRGLEGIMAKDRRSPYVPGQADRPLAEGQDPARAGARRRRLGDGHRQGGRPRRAPRRRLRGRRAALRRQDRRRASRTPTGPSCWPRVAPLAADASPFAPPPPRAAARDARWLRPELVIRAEFAGWTGDGLVRQAAYKGIELEKDPRKVIRERPAALTDVRAG